MGDCLKKLKAGLHLLSLLLLSHFAHASIQIYIPAVGFGDQLDSSGKIMSPTIRLSEWDSEASNWLAVVFRDAGLPGSSPWSLELVREADSRRQKSSELRLPRILLDGNWPLKDLQIRWIRDRKWASAGSKTELDSVLVVHDGLARVYQFLPEPVVYSTLPGFEAVIRSERLRGALLGPHYFDSELGVFVLPLFDSKGNLRAVEASIDQRVDQSDSRETAALRSIAKTRLNQTLKKWLMVVETEASKGEEGQRNLLRPDELVMQLNELAEEIDAALTPEMKQLLRSKSQLAASVANSLVERLLLSRPDVHAEVKCANVF